MRDSDSSSADEEAGLGKLSGKRPALRPKRKPTVGAHFSLPEMLRLIPPNYRKHKLDTAGVQISVKTDPLNPLHIGWSSNTQDKILLTGPKVKELNGVLDRVFAKKPVVTDPIADEREVAFMVNLFGGCASTRSDPGWLGNALHQQREGVDSQQKSAFHDSFMYSCVSVGCYVHGIPVCILLTL